MIGIRKIIFVIVCWVVSGGYKKERKYIRGRDIGKMGKVIVD